MTSPRCCPSRQKTPVGPELQVPPSLKRSENIIVLAHFGNLCVGASERMFHRLNCMLYKKIVCGLTSGLLESVPGSQMIII